MPTSTAEATWDGPVKEGGGHLALGSGVWEESYTFASRFEDGDETNPEGLVGAAEGPRRGAHRPDCGIPVEETER